MASYRVLIVDDQRDIRRVLRGGLETLDRDIEVIDVPSGEEAILVISRQPIDLLVTDVRLPGISGLELQERTKVRNPNLKLMLITGVSEPKLRREVASAGADAFFFKPVELSEFLDAVAFCLGFGDSDKASDQSLESQEAPTLSERMSILHQDLEAEAVILIDERGEVIAQTKTLSEQVINPTLLSSLMAAGSAVAKVSDLVGAGAFKDLIYFTGNPYDYVASHVGESIVLLLVLPKAGDDDKRIFTWTRHIRLAVQDLLEILSKMGVWLDDPHEAHPESEDKEPEDEEPEDEVDISEVIPEIDALFEQAGQPEFQSQDVDSFWDSMVSGDETQSQIHRSDSLTFEQAQQLGLAPDEE